MNILMIDNSESDIEFFLKIIEACRPATLFHSTFDLKASQAYVDALIVMPDYIFLDLKIENEAGLELLRFLKETEKLAETKIVIFSDYLDTDALQKFTSLGAYKVMQKPSSWVNFELTMSRFFDKELV